MNDRPTPNTAQSEWNQSTSAGVPFWMMMLVPVLLAFLLPPVLFGARAGMERLVARNDLSRMNAVLQQTTTALTPTERSAVTCGNAYSGKNGNEGVINLGTRLLAHSSLPGGTHTLDCQNGVLTLNVFIFNRYETLQAFPSGEIRRLPAPPGLPVRPVQNTRREQTPGRTQHTEHQQP